MVQTQPQEWLPYYSMAQGCSCGYIAGPKDSIFMQEPPQGPLKSFYGPTWSGGDLNLEGRGIGQLVERDKCVGGGASVKS